MNTLSKTLFRRVRDWAYEPTVRGLDVDGLEFSAAHREILLNKGILRDLFGTFYRRTRALDLKYFGTAGGRRLEIGSGSSIVKTFYKDVITSDIKPLPWVDLALTAEGIPFGDGSLRAIYGTNVFHHLPHPRKFFAESIRVLEPGGGVILVDVYNSWLCRRLLRNLHDCEGYDETARVWEAPITGPLSGANQALTYMIFERDCAQYEREFPELEIVEDIVHTQAWYYLSGGVNFRQLLPDWATPAAATADFMLNPLNRWLALLHTVVLRKRP